MRKLSFTILCYFLTLWSPSIFTAPVSDGNLLLKSCKHGNTLVENSLPNLTQQELYEAGYCHGLMRGVLSVLVSDYSNKTCIPEEVNNFQSARIVVNFLENNPKLLYKSDYELSIEALTNAYPCVK